MATLDPVLTAAIVAIAILAVLAAIWWRRRAAARRALLAAAVPAEPGEETSAPSEDATFAPPDAPVVAAAHDVALTAPGEPSPASSDDTTFAPPTGADVAIPYDAPPLALVSDPVVDPSTPTTVSFHLLLPTQGHARSAGQIARREGYTADVQPPREGSTSWLCLLTREMMPTPEEIETERAYLAQLAEGFGGRLDRWDADGRR